MRILISSSIVLLSAAFATQTLACDRHGGMFGQLNGASWTDYNPATAESDALFLEERLSEWHKQNTVQPAEAKPTKPSFSKASTRAAMAAQARLAKRVNLEEQDKAKTTSTAASDTPSEMASR